MLANGYSNASAILKGFNAWLDAGYPVSTGTEQGTTGEKPDQVLTNLSVSELQAMMVADDFFFANVHVPFEGNIPGTDANIPFDDIPAYLDQFPADKDAPIVLYCKSNSMSLTAAEELIRLGFTNLYNLDGGFQAWEKAGHELEAQ